jgi:hypothetical protein
MATAVADVTVLHFPPFVAVAGACKTPESDERISCSVIEDCKQLLEEDSQRFPIPLVIVIASACHTYKHIIYTTYFAINYCCLQVQDYTSMMTVCGPIIR